MIESEKMNEKIYVVGIIITPFCLAFSGCVSSTQDIIIDDTLYQNSPRDPVSINNVKLVENNLFMNISYGGGCEEHEFTLIATTFMESEPVQVNIILSHEDNDDPCDMWINENHSYNLLPLKKSWQLSYQAKSGSIVMNIEGWNESIIYQF